MRTLALLVAGIAASSMVGATSLYDERIFQPLAADRRARAPGDLITVLVYENSSATTSADTRLGRVGRLGLSLDRSSKSRTWGVSTDNDSDGRGRTAREGRVVAQITVSVRDVAPNGDLVVAGKQILEINNERQEIRVEGRIRRADVAENNTILSTRLADAAISFAGDGDIAERQRPSWWHRALTWFGL